jgi:hypothetical protein
VHPVWLSCLYELASRLKIRKGLNGMFHLACVAVIVFESDEKSSEIKCWSLGQAFSSLHCSCWSRDSVQVDNAS